MREAEFAAPPDPHQYVQTDGEYAGRLPAKVEIVPAALTLLVPRRFQAAEERFLKRT